jgi:serine/threonine protein kinase
MSIITTQKKVNDYFNTEYGLFQQVAVNTGFDAHVVFTSANDGVIPPGFELDSTTGKLAGTPTNDAMQEQNYTINVDVAAENTDGEILKDSAFKVAEYTLEVFPAIEETGSRGYTATVGTQYMGQVPDVRGGRPPLVFTFSRVDSTSDLPLGLDVNNSTGQITGIPTQETAATTLAVVVTDANGSAKRLQTMGLTVRPSIRVTWTKPLHVAAVDDAYVMNKPQVLEEHEIAFYRNRSLLPPGLELDAGTGKLYGHPTKPGLYTLTIIAYDEDGSKATVSINGSAPESQGSSNSSQGVFVSTSSLVLLEVAECMDAVQCSGAGTCERGDDFYDGEYSCTCDSKFEGSDCSAAASTSGETEGGTTGTIVIVAVVAFLLCGAVAFKVNSGKDRRRQIGMARKAAEPSHGATKVELTEGLLAAVEYGEYGLVPALVNLGADASVRGHSGQLPHASALMDRLQLSNPVHLAAIKSLFGAHCEFDAQIGACMRLDVGSHTDSKKLVQHVLCEMASSAWRSASTGDTVAHKILEGCITASLNEAETVQLMEAVLECDHDLLTTSNNRTKTPTELAIMCEGKQEIQSRFTVVLFERYQIVRPQHPLYKSPTAEVHECVDLAELSNPEHVVGNNKRYVVKLMANPDLWLRELKTRDTLGKDATGSFVGAISAAAIGTEEANMDKGDVVLHRMVASKYAKSANSVERPITMFPSSFIKDTRRDEARQLMIEYPYAIQMPLADRNLNEIIASERLAEEPLDVIRQSSRKLLKLIEDLHDSGVIHGDVKPKNVVRVDRQLMLIDLDMSITVGSSEPPAHASSEKFSGSTAYAAPELHRWMGQHIYFKILDASYMGDGSSPLDKLVTPHQVDLWSFAVTLYEMATGSALFQNSYDKATPAALAQLKDWKGLDANHLHQIESLHGSSESAALRDVLMWTFQADAANRPQSVAEIKGHAFFDPRRGAMREDFVVNQIKRLLSAPPSSNGGKRININVMVSYCWTDSNFVLSQLTMELAPRIRELWLDRLGGDQGMGEFAQASMKRGVRNADVIIAVVSPSYIKSVNCGYEMALAHAMGKPVIPVVLGVPFNEWPPQLIGESTMNTQFATEAGDLKIFIDMTDQASFFQKFEKELLPRLSGGAFQTAAVMSTQQVDVQRRNPDVATAPTTPLSRPQKHTSPKKGILNNMGIPQSPYGTDSQSAGEWSGAGLRSVSETALDAAVDDAYLSVASGLIDNSDEDGAAATVSVTEFNSSYNHAVQNALHFSSSQLQTVGGGGSSDDDDELYQC